MKKYTVLSKGFGRKCNIHTKTVVRTIPVVYFSWGKQTEERRKKNHKNSGENWSKLKKHNFSTISAEELLIPNIWRQSPIKKYRTKWWAKQHWNWKKTIKLIEQHTYEKKNKKNTILEALILAEERHTIKEESIQRMEKFGARPKIRTMWKRLCRFCGAPNWTPLHKCPAK